MLLTLTSGVTQLKNIFDKIPAFGYGFSIPSYNYLIEVGALFILRG